MIFVKENAPHLRRNAGVARLMLDVVIALLPTLVFSFCVYQLATLYTLLISLATMLLAEFIYVGLKNMMKWDGQKHSFKERFIYAYKNYSINNITAPLVSSIIYTLIMPPSAPYYAVFVGALVGIALGKLVFGGLGSNIFNPAAVGMVFSKICFGSSFSTLENTWYYSTPIISGGTGGDVSVGGTALTNISNGIEHIYDYSLLDMFLGKMPGTLGEAFTITILIGAIYLIIRRSADFRIMLSYLVTFVAMMAVAGLCIHSLYKDIDVGYFLGFQLLSGGLFFGAVFMLTDPVTSPTNRPGRIIFGMIAGVVTVFIRLFGALPEGVAFSILIANMFVPVIEHYKWSSNFYTWKKILCMAIIFIIPTIIMILAVLYGGVIVHG